ncbi:MAG TPA: hypothetical protein VM598_02665 [Bdellovibrionota bacterium]|nr:hypothetical protein [Bdellovibrionota bacterium]
MSPAVYRLFPLVCLALLALLPATRAGAGPKLSVPATRVPVTLFGQPCVLEGPLGAVELKAIHSISPEEICTPFSSERTIDETRKSMDRLKSTTGLPSGLDRYRERLTKRLKAELAFLEGLAEARRKKSVQPLLVATQEFIVSPRKRTELENSAKAFVAAADGTNRWQQQTQLFDVYNEAIEAKPEDEFHRAIRTMNVQYTCSFEEATGESEE